MHVFSSALHPNTQELIYFIDDGEIRNPMYGLCHTKSTKLKHDKGHKL